ncbi:MAG: hypothetical protein L6Q54_08160 [Leptospiraceae bacterium]|nr:hypothetical protein [Leptospiraceae bacterium]MCK6381208.1 hypothetical protein [Leptospiraceae bacterium]NUM42965.1 hypothetical protein [Leptospiraceae bacterium]
MIQKIPFRLAVNTSLCIFISAIFYHLLVIAGVIPHSIVWGGRIENNSQMVIFEIVSISILLIIMFFIGMKANLIKKFISEKIITIMIYGLSLLFALNTIGNIFSLSKLESLLFTPITLLLSVLCFRIASEKK